MGRSIMVILQILRNKARTTRNASRLPIEQMEHLCNKGGLERDDGVRVLIRNTAHR